MYITAGLLRRKGVREALNQMNIDYKEFKLTLQSLFIFQCSKEEYDILSELFQL